MVIHVKYAPVARGTMMASLWLENVAHQAISSSLIFIITKMESPKHWDLSRISGHSLEK